MKKTKKKKNPKSKGFAVQDSLKQFFPRTSRMGFSVPTPWGKPSRGVRTKKIAAQSSYIA
jgi:hypothetical protein